MEGRNEGLVFVRSALPLDCMLQSVEAFLLCSVQGARKSGTLHCPNALPRCETVTLGAHRDCKSTVTATWQWKQEHSD